MQLMVDGQFGFETELLEHGHPRIPMLIAAFGYGGSENSFAWLAAFLAHQGT
jgi:hypothetical protein